MSDDTPEIVLNEFGDLSRKARRELEAQGIDPDTAVLDFKIATGRIPIITEDQAAAAKEASAPAATPSEPPVHQTPPAEPTVPAEPTATSQPEPPVQTISPVSEMTVAPESVPAVEQTGFPRVDNTVVSANTGPIEPLSVEPALDNSALAAVEETLAAAAEKPSSAFDDFFSPEEPESEVIVDEKPAKLGRKEKKALAKEAKQAQKESPPAMPKDHTSDVGGNVVTGIAVAALAAAPEESAQHIRRRHVADSNQDETQESYSDYKVNEDSYVFEVSEELTVIYEDESEAPQTISEATAAIAIAEAVAAAEATSDTNEIVLDYESTSGVPTTTGSIPVITNALILPSLPETTGQISPITPTGEVVITGSILIPPSVAQVGVNAENLDTSDVDIISGDQEVTNTSTHLAPVSAAAAVSAYDIASSVITKPKGTNEKLPFILSIAAAGLAVGVVALLVVGYISGIF